MPKEHKVQPGDCISSIAYESGFFPDTLWNHPSNAALKAKRKNPNVLAPGDAVNIPDLREKKESRDTGKEYRFRKRGVPAELRLKVLDDGEPVANCPFIVSIDNIPRSGLTDGQGCIHLAIPPNARRANVRVGEDPDVIEYQLNLGHLQPIEDLAGVQARLNGLGYHCGGEDGQFGDGTEQALRGFQRQYDLPVTGTLDESTRSKLKQISGE